MDIVTESKTNLGGYLNSREYLKDFYQYKKSSHQGVRAYNYSNFSAAADIKSPSYLRLIIEGKRNLSPEMAVKFSKALKLNKIETTEFCQLVLYTQESDPLKRNEYLRDIALLRVERKIQAGEISREQYEKVPNWVAWVLYALVDQKDIEFSPESLKLVLKNKVKTEIIEKALFGLFKNGQLIKLEDGKVRKSNKPLSSSSDIPVALVRKIQAELNYRGMESLFEDSPEEREFGALTVSLTKEEFTKYRFELRQLRKKIHKEVAVNRSEEKGDRVYQLNLQLFPVTDEA